jgi:hypothetical protein
LALKGPFNREAFAQIDIYRDRRPVNGPFRADDSNAERPQPFGLG